MSWLQSLDVALFRFINVMLSNPVLDQIMPWLSWNRFFVPAVILLSIGLVWKGGVRGRICVLLLLASFALGETLVINTLKHAIGRLRPYHDVADAHLLVGRGGSGSMPSGHSSTWFAATLVAYVFYRRSVFFLLPAAITIAFSRVYLGVHYPSDVLAGAILGAGYAAAGLLAANALWQSLGRSWFPDWWHRLPAPLNPVLKPELQLDPATARVRLDQHLMRLGYVIIAVIFIARLGYIASGRIQLAEDEAYQWLWSKHLALSYYSKPPLIAFTQFLGTTLWGDNAFGVRFFSPVITALLSVAMLRFMARVAGVRAAFWLVLIVNCTPLIAVGGTLMTIDPLLVMFWTAAMTAGWRAIQPQATTGDWLWVGLWMGLGFLSKYSAAFQIVCWAIFFAAWPPARAQLARPGPWLALLVNLVATLPVLVWNSRHGWITVTHVSQNARFDQPWEPTLRYFWEFLGAELLLLHPIFLLTSLWAMFAFWKTARNNPLLVYFFCMSAPVFLGYWLFALHSRVLPNWIAPAVLPMSCLMVVYWDKQWQSGQRALKPLLLVALVIGYAGVIIMHDSDLLAKITGHTLPLQKDPLRRVRAWRETAAVVGVARHRLLAEGKPVFIIADHYGLVGQISFYLPEARTNVQREPLAYFRTADSPQNQFYFWPGYQVSRKGQNAIFVHEVDLPELGKHWLAEWLRGRTKLEEVASAGLPEPPPQLTEEFESVSDLGVFDVEYRDRVFRRLQLFACRQLR